jgi:hypothetical protein
MERVAWVWQCLGYLALDRGDDAAAALRLSDAFTLRRTQGHLPGLATVLDGMAVLATRAAATRDARELFAIADQLRSAAGIRPGSDDPTAQSARTAVGAPLPKSDDPAVPIDQLLTTAEALLSTTLFRRSTLSL